MFAIISNYTQFATAETLKEAKTVAVDESYKYDDVVTITKNGIPTHMAQHGVLYKLTTTK